VFILRITPLMLLISLAVVALLLPICTQAFYLPGAAPHDYVLGQKVNLFVNALTPMLMSKDDAKLVSEVNFLLVRLLCSV
jgi:transmembrane 9 superfamily member 2/4